MSSMCRIFAMAAEQDIPPVIRSRLLREFFQSSAETYSGGWGIGYFTDDGPMVIKEPIKATDSFPCPGPSAGRNRDSSWPMSETLPRAKGASSTLTLSTRMGGCSPTTARWGTHPSRLGLLERYSDTLQGDTDSEIMFHFMLQRMEEAGQAESGVLSAVRELCTPPGRGNILPELRIDGRNGAVRAQKGLHQ